ncbi:Rv3235 family protein [Euzebya sp.]|uniref:Rv3235 family protein n=1 Tax=Euzebya sp. TaxID=1971409 RepID=UPI0035153792
MSAAADDARAGRARWLQAFVTLYLEVEAGLRPARHLRPFLAPDLRLDLAVRGRPGPVPAVVRTLTQRHGAVCEAVVLLADRGRVGALAIAVRCQDHRWRVTDIRRPEALAPPAAPDPAGAVEAVEVIEIAVDPAPAPEVRPVIPGPTWTVPAGWRRPARAA